MDELLFPVAAVAVTFLVVIPALTLASRAVLARRRRRARSLGDFGTESVFAWLVMPSLLPVLWLTSSALHQSEPSRLADTCLIAHVHPTTCLDAILLLGLLSAGLAASVAHRVWRERLRFAVVPLAPDQPLSLRVAGLVAADPRLRRLRTVVTRSAPAPVCAVGWFRRRVLVDACFVRDSDDAMLRAALLHESAHVDAFDTFRSAVARLCLGINPVGQWLAPDLERWHQAREAHCDSAAVHRGGDALALAEGIVRAARFHCVERARCGAAMLCGDELSTLRLRLTLLLHGPPSPVRTAGHLVLGAALLAALVLPHVAGADLLEHFHFEVERLLHPLG
ncbi:MAG: hypothetical protein H6744_14550 [Deltaproteobacteria bacterium]|nr:hypothetical protein [Deltaproteobacteria bacterium]MCB9787901.1 hypothetical protein [Deltaproteobacteria bacterium]